MSTDTQTAPPKVSAVAPLGSTATRGFVFFLGQALTIKCISMAGQIALSYILNRDDFGFVSQAYTVAFLVSLFQQAGVREIMIQRGRRYRLWANSAFWFILTTSVICCVMMLLLARPAAWFYNNPRLPSLLGVLALCMFGSSLNIIPESKLQIDLRFRLLAGTGVLGAAAGMSSGVLLAWLGFGAFSFIWPILIVEAVRAAIFWPLARPPIRLPVRARRWKYFFADSGLLIASSFFITVVWQGGYVILGRTHCTDVVGVYYWAFNFSAQSLQLLAINMAGILLPSISKLQDEPARQHQACLRALRGLAILTVPACALQAALADPLIRIVFQPRWYVGIRLVEILSLGWIFFVVYHSSTSILKAQKRNSALAAYTGVSALLFVAIAILGAQRAAAVGVATATAVFAVLTGPLGVYVALRAGGGTWRQVAGIFGPPLAITLLAGAIALPLSWLVPAGPWRHAFRAAIILAVGGPAYMLLLRFLAPAAWNDLADRLHGILRRPATGPQESQSPPPAPA